MALSAIAQPPTPVPSVRQSTTTPPHPSHTVLWHRLQPYSTPRLPQAACRQWRIRVRPSIPLRPPADPDPYKRPAVPTPLPSSLPAFRVPPSHLNVRPHLGQTPRTSDIATRTRHTTPPLCGADTHDAANVRSADYVSNHLRSSSSRHYTRHVVHRLGRRLHPTPGLTPVAHPRF